MSILVSGSLVYDHIMNFPDSFKNHIMPEQIHILNVCFMVDKLERSWGGTAGNIAFTLKMLGGEPVVVSAVGKDGKDYVDYLRLCGIDAKNILTDDKQLTASAYITTDADDNQITAFYNGPLDLAKNISVRNLGNELAVALISPTHKEVMAQHLKECAELGIKAVFDPGQQMTAFSEIELKKMINQAYFVIGNDYEIKMLQTKTGWDAEELLKNTKVLITTLGERGSVIATADGEQIEVGICPPLSFDDPTGAGDAYRAGFFFGYEKGFDWKTCGQMGAVAASYAIETFGTQEHNFTKEEFRERYKKTFNEEIKF
ncbi:MAG: Sugar kinase [Candidatus Magasanikbacteria bacterium GW2011_GWC2_34_16]|uniref:Sugar kinase n=2 Tax=Candidatus Magasanikiibacteriota TaxID=1752731 RepID=A0A0G0KFL0_9BACT|nr:MAG: Sugar kinase [Candidatus Magasanikbacteria bacterium GW2011_GWC2_34_16]KKQ39376.1 MAG: Sugar kinase [Candidatus Magasanikbacteria bacterium GW2011_GWA2_37_8]